MSIKYVYIVKWPFFLQQICGHSIISPNQIVSLVDDIYQTRDIEMSILLPFWFQITPFGILKHVFDYIIIFVKWISVVEINYYGGYQFHCHYINNDRPCDVSLKWNKMTSVKIYYGINKVADLSNGVLIFAKHSI